MYFRAGLLNQVHIDAHEDVHLRPNFPSAVHCSKPEMGVRSPVSSAFTECHQRACQVCFCSRFLNSPAVHPESSSDGFSNVQLSCFGIVLALLFPNLVRTIFRRAAFLARTGACLATSKNAGLTDCVIMSCRTSHAFK